MKKLWIAVLAMVVVSIVLLSTAAQDFSTYSSFAEAIETGKKVKVVGKLAKQKEIYYKPTEDPNYFSFYVEDMEGVTNKVVLLAEKPQDFEKTEQIVLTGKMTGEEFVASDMLVKCPSKYKDEEIYIKGAEMTMN